MTTRSFCVGYDDYGVPEDRFLSEEVQRDLEREGVSTRKSSSGCKISCCVLGLALAIIGSLALAGLHYPHSSLGPMGQAIGQTGSISMVAVGGGILLLTALGYCCARRKKDEYEVEVVSHIEDVPGQITGYPTYGDIPSSYGYPSSQGTNYTGAVGNPDRRHVNVYSD